ncbi:UDP-glucose--hexose-1-phosphate uridylyltransferase [Halobacillus sp. A5]|uniref:UDP-glucose--hexose-1-phosphate uridylyltransferase n=1 Tax=Halobacillus sp. A5 TaxID=2880263 RepID=UPI0020A69630|nr:UDP-glucose--hexose-1-phosphate uridylyltransferase [Halobacillus sp. A5]MCP3028047.1 UDP-glucose--hexose-1-phosphate uridylyltransferase [Halobacillus sp. A5]
MEIYQNIDRLVSYGLQKGLISVWDVDYIRNAYYRLFSLNGQLGCTKEAVEIDSPVPIIKEMLRYADNENIIDGSSVTECDLFDAKIMDIITPSPSEVIKGFYKTYENAGAIEATKRFYERSKEVYYIRTDRIAQNLHWFSHTDYGNLEITINLSKPEKDPKAIAAARSGNEHSYPECLLCKENVGYPGRMDHPARDNHRIIPIELTEERWFLQFSPYVYYNEHAIVFSRDHRPMKISKEGFNRLLSFTEQFPHYFIGSNADLPIVGGSILSHDHFQGGNHEFPMAKATVEETFEVQEFEDVQLGIVKWPMSVLRLRGTDKGQVTELASRILDSWRLYSDETAGINAESKGVPHNTITPIARFKDDSFELDLVLRNNRTSDQHPYGIFHPHEEVHHIKKENIGLIEVMGLAVLPGRLKEEIDLLAFYLSKDQWKEAEHDDHTAKHVNWARQLLGQESGACFNEKKLKRLLNEGIGQRFSTVLEHAGVFKRTDQGGKAFRRFVHQL